MPQIMGEIKTDSPLVQKRDQSQGKHRRKEREMGDEEQDYKVS